MLLGKGTVKRVPKISEIQTPKILGWGQNFVTRTKM